MSETSDDHNQAHGTLPDPTQTGTQGNLGADQQDATFLAQILKAFQTSQEKILGILQENTKVLGQTLATIAHLVPSSSSGLTQNSSPRVEISGGSTHAGEVVTTPQVIDTLSREQTPARQANTSSLVHPSSSQIHVTPSQIHPSTAQVQAPPSQFPPLNTRTQVSMLPISSGSVTYLTKEDLEKFFEEQQTILPSSMLDLKLPYPSSIAAKAYPKDYVSPKFKLFNGKQWNAKEHIMKFIETLGVHALDDDLKLKEFSKSLIEKAYTWYVNLTLGFVDSWGTMCGLFSEKFFSTQERVTIIDMGRVYQRSKEDLMEYIERFRERALDIQEACDEKELVKICIRGMFTEYAVHLENLALSSFAALVENARRTNNSVLKHKGERFFKRNDAVSSIEEGNSRQNKKSRGGSLGGYYEPPSFPFSMNEVYVLLDQWVEDHQLNLPEIQRQPTEEEKAHPKYCRYHRTVGHSTQDCRNLRRIVHGKIRNGQLIVDDNDLRKNPLPLHGNIMGQTNAIINNSTEELQDHLPSTYECNRPLLEQQEEVLVDESIARALMKISSVNRLFDQLGFNEEAKFAAAFAVMKISRGQYEESDVINRSIGRPGKGKENAITFTNADMCIKSPNHNHPLHVEGVINEFLMKKTFIDSESSLNIMPLSTFKAITIHEECLVKQAIDIQAFDDAFVHTLGYADVDFEMGSIQCHIRFHVIDANVDYKVLIGRKWLHDHNLIPSTLHQCIKGYWNGRDIFIPTSEKLFGRHETSISEVASYDGYAYKREAEGIHGQKSRKRMSSELKSKEDPKLKIARWL